MYKQQRLDEIMKILQENTFVTVKFLCQKLHYSPATINRDLNLLEGQKLIKRTYGGAELLHDKHIPLLLRYDYMKTEKRKIGKEASKFVEDNDVIFIDGSTTTSFMAEHLVDRHNLTVITSNIAVATYLSQYKITVHLLGGKIVEVPNIILDEETIKQASNYRADKVFFATANITSDGVIGSMGLSHVIHQTMLKNSTKSYYLCDHEKVDYAYTTTNKIVCDLSKIDVVISDYEFPKTTKETYNNTTFIKV